MNLPKVTLEQWLDELIFALQKQLIMSKTSFNWAFWLKLISQTRQMIKDNVHPERALDWLMIKLN